MRDHLENDKIVITGIAGRFPQCENVEEFKDALLNGVDLVKEDSSRYPAGIWNTPKQAGTIRNIDKFDASFFGIHPKQVTFMDARHRILLETVYESIIDAGYNPKELRGRKIGVYVGIPNFTKGELYRVEKTGGYTNIGLNLAIAANRISYCFDFKGPSFVLDTACSSAIYALVCAIKDMLLGETEGAIVCGSHLIQHPFETAEFERLNMLSPQGKCKVFSTDRDGYARAESVVCYFIQRESKSRRIYATVCGAKASSDGYKKEGITVPSALDQYLLMQELYKSVNIDPGAVTYVEAHGTGTPIGDIVECEALTKHFCENRKNPLPIGAVKSNMGHSEIASGLCSLTKVLIAMETGIIPANLHTELLDKTLPGIKDNKLQVVTKNMKWDGGIVGMNCFGFGGADAHVIIDSHKKEKVTEYKSYKNRLVQFSGRTEEAVLHIIDEIEKNQNDAEFLAMIDEIHKTHVDGHNYRGYLVLGDSPVKEMERYTKKRPIWFVYTGMGCQWNKMGVDLMNNDTFKTTINRCATALAPYGVDLINIITNTDPDVFNDITSCFCAIGCVEIALTDVLYSMNIFPDGICGHSLGEVGCAYADGQITPEQAALLVYSRGYGSANSQIIQGQMAAIGLSKEEVRKILPEGVFIACQNGKESVTISGPLEITKAFVERLSSQGIFARLVKSAGIPFHTKYLAEAGKLLLQFCKNVLKDPKPRSSKWVSSSVPPNREHEEWARLNGAEYHHNNFCNTVLFDQVYERIPENAIVIEVAPHGLLQAILKREMGPETTKISITNRSSDDNEKFFLSAIGKIYLSGGQPNLRNLYNDVSFPVSRGTKMLAPLVKWDHSVSWFSGIWENKDSFGQTVTISLSDNEFAYLEGHNIDGRVLMPATGYLELVWSIVAQLQLKEKEQLPIIMENLKFKRATVLTSGDGVKFLVNIMKQSGYFEIFESGSIVCTGKVRLPKDISTEFIQKEIKPPKKGYLPLSQEEVYRECRIRKYMYKDFFQGITECDVHGHYGKIIWKGKFCSFLDTMLHMTLVATTDRRLRIPTGIRQFIIDPVQHLKMIQGQEELQISFNPELNTVKSGAVEIIDAEFSIAPRRQNVQDPAYVESYEFVYYETNLRNQYDLSTSLSIATQIVLQNTKGLVKSLTICEIITEDINEDVSKSIKDILDKQALINVKFYSASVDKLNSKNDIIVVSEAVLNNQNFADITPQLTDTGFILYKGKYNKNDKFEIIFESLSDDFELYLLRPTSEFPKNHTVLNIRNLDIDWLEELKTLFRREESTVAYLYSEEATSGIIGLAKCLMCEPSNVTFKTIFIDQVGEKFSIEDELCRRQLKKNLAFNVYKENKWGTYVYLPMKELEKRVVDNATVNIATPGDLSTLEWIERPFEGTKIFEDSERVYVYYSALNFKDVMIATGKLVFEGLEDMPTALNSGLGFEYSGITVKGKRIMGMISSESMSLQICSDPYFTWEVPDGWTLRDACTIPCVYSTCYYGLILRGQMQCGESILIHAGTGGVGLAAINIALSMGCEVFTTVSTIEKRDFLKTTFPQLKDENIGNSRDVSFEIMIKEKTKGRGVDLVLNSLANELFQASMRCLAPKGRFLEIGKIDLINSSPIPSSMFLRNISFHGVHLEQFFYPQSAYKRKIQELVADGIASGVVKPLPNIAYEETQVESAFRFLASGKHKGKVIIEIRKEELYSPTAPIRGMTAVPKILLDPKKSYIVIGGLGGYGLELTNWLIQKGATKITLNSRKDTLNGYQSYCMKKWSQFKGIIVQVNTMDTSTVKGAEHLIKASEEMGPVGGIFHLAMSLRDGIVTNQTVENFQEVFKSKIVSGQNLDVVSRKLCAELDHFVVFSSIVSGRGTAGQTNYGMANSALERLCEIRRREQLPALAVEWGPLGEVGILEKLKAHDKLFHDVEPQTIDSSLKTLEKLMLQTHTAVACSVVLHQTTASANVSTKTPIEAVAHIMGIRNLNLIDKSLTLSQLGLDSLMVTEIKQTLYRNFNLELSTEEIQEITLNDLVKSPSDSDAKINTPDKSIDKPNAYLYLLQDKAMIKLNDSTSNKNIFLLHPIEGNVDILKALGSKLKAVAYGLQCTMQTIFDTIPDFASFFINQIKKVQSKGPYYVCGYSYGCSVMTEMTVQLEKSGEKVNLIYIDGSPTFVREILKSSFMRQDSSKERSQQTTLELFCSCFSLKNDKEIEKSVNNGRNWESKINCVSEIISKVTGLDKLNISASADCLYRRIQAGYLYEPSSTIEAQILLIRRTDNPFIAENYELEKICKQPFETVKIDGDHKTILLGKNTQIVADTINNFCNI